MKSPRWSVRRWLMHVADTVGIPVGTAAILEGHLLRTAGSTTDFKNDVEDAGCNEKDDDAYGEDYRIHALRDLSLLVGPQGKDQSQEGD